jgi:hypothetical protein
MPPSTVMMMTAMTICVESMSSLLSTRTGVGATACRQV